jgi:hypothetical protein
MSRVGAGGKPARTPENRPSGPPVGPIPLRGRAIRRGDTQRAGPGEIRGGEMPCRDSTASARTDAKGVSLTRCAEKNS